MLKITAGTSYRKINDTGKYHEPCEINPKQVYKWFMEMFESSDWVMAPNVYGMGLFSDGDFCN